MRVLLALVLAAAAAGCVLASSGLAVPPHVDPPGTPRIHDHLLAAYRYPLFLMRLKMLSHPVAGPSWTLQTPGGLELGGLILATLALSVPRLPRPTRRATAVLAAPALRLAQWRLDAPLGPPRALLLATP
ncbi:MAG TPA: hypothetical protein VGA38_08765 [Candidatus Limnocylindria bacterium]